MYLTVSINGSTDVSLGVRYYQHVCI